MILKRKEP